MESKYRIEYDEISFMYYVTSPHVSMGPYSKGEADNTLRILQDEEAAYEAEHRNDPPTLEDLVVNVTVEDVPLEELKGEVSDGGSSAYYSFEMMACLEGDRVLVEVETEDVIQAGFTNNFDLGNVVKAARRIAENYEGRGKEGIDALYDWRKILYTAQKNIKWIEEKK